VINLIEVTGRIKVYFNQIEGLEPQSYMEKYLEELREIEEYIDFKGGSHTFKNGSISIFQYPSKIDEEISMIWRFSKVKDLEFIDKLFKTALKFNDKCFISISIKDNIDFNRLKSWIKSYSLKWLGESGESFSAIIDFGGQILWLTAYTNRNIFNIRGKFRLDGLKPSKIIRILCEGETLKVLSVRVPSPIKHSYIQNANRLGLTASELIREALKKYLIELYKSDIEELTKIE